MRLAVLLATSLLATPVFAADGCVVDYNTLKVRAVEAHDLSMTVPEQSGKKFAWVAEGMISIAKLDFMKEGEPLTMAAPDLTFVNFKDSAPLLKLAADGEQPTMIFALLDAATCEVQPYKRMPTVEKPAS